jgi:hypothetical protein
MYYFAGASMPAGPAWRGNYHDRQGMIAKAGRL